MTGVYTEWVVSGQHGGQQNRQPFRLRLRRRVPHCSVLQYYKCCDERSWGQTQGENGQLKLEKSIYGKETYDEMIHHPHGFPTGRAIAWWNRTAKSMFGSNLNPGRSIPGE